MDDAVRAPEVGRPAASDLAGLSPFEVKAALVRLAAASARRSGAPLLDAGRGNPNWVATTPRAAFFLLGEFALAESRRVWEEPDLGGMPARERDRATGFAQFLADARRRRRRRRCSRRTLDYGESLGFDADEFVYELTDGIIGDHYPGPDRICVHVEQILREYLADELLEGDAARRATGTCSRSRAAPRRSATSSTRSRRTSCSDPGDRVALMVPAFTPYLEIPRLDRYGLDVDRDPRVRRSTRTTIRRGSSPTPRSTSSPTRRSRRCSW